MELSKALIEFNLEADGVIERFNITQLNNPCVVYLTLDGEDTCLYKQDNKHLPWIAGSCLFDTMATEVRYTVIMEQ